MATFSLGTSGVTPGAPGVYINEQAGLAASANLANFSTVYMLVETEEQVPVTKFPFNSPKVVTSLADYRVLIDGVIPTSRIPLLSYNCVNEFFQNAQVGDLRVVRVGTPNQIVEIELFPSGKKLSSSGLPSALMAGDKVYVQMKLNGVKLVAGDGSTGFTADGEWLGVPVVIPVNYIAGDEVNNRKIAVAISTAIAAAIESNPSVRSSVYVRDFGLVKDIDPAQPNSQNSYVTIAATTFDANVSVVTESNPVGSAYVFMQDTYDIANIIGQQGNLQRVPQDYIQCINTAFDGQQDQGYLITPTAYAQFNAQGRSDIGAAAAAHCASNNYKWMALADPGPYLITDVNEYDNYVPHQPAADLDTGSKYLVDNAIYEWIGTSVSYNRLTYQEIISDAGKQIAVIESTNSVPANAKVGLLDPAAYTMNSLVGGNLSIGKIDLSTTAYWPVDLQIQEVQVSSAVGDFAPLNGTTAYIVAPPFDTAVSGSYSTNVVYLATTATAASSILTQVIAAGGTTKMIITPTGAFNVGVPAGGTASITYTTPYWNQPVTINGQTSNLIQNLTSNAVGVNTAHLPATLQTATDSYRLGFTTRTIFNPAVALGGIAAYSGASTVFAGAANFNIPSHGLQSGDEILFTQPVKYTVGGNTFTLFQNTTKVSQTSYYVTVVDLNNFVLSTNLTNFSASSFVQFPTGGAVLVSSPTILYSTTKGGNLTAATLSELTTIPMIRARKYGFASGTISNEAADSTVVPTPSASNPVVSIYLNQSSLILGSLQITPYGETTSAGWLSKLQLVNPGTTSTSVDNFFCVPTLSQSFSTESYLVPAIDPILGGDYDGATTAVAALSQYVLATGLVNGDIAATIQAAISKLVGVYFNVLVAGFAPDGTTPVAAGDFLAVTYDGTTYSWTVVPPAADGGDLTTVGQPLYGSQIELFYSPEETPPLNLWLFDAITSTEIIDNALRGVGFNGDPQAKFIEAGVDNVSRLYEDSQRYSNPFGFIAYYGPYIQNSADQWIPPSPYVTGVAVRRYRAEGYQFPPAGVKYQLIDASATQIPINSAQQNLLNPDGCNAIRTLPGYPQSAVYIWGGRTRLPNPDDAQQKLYQFVNTRVILNVVYGSLRRAFDSQIFNVIDGFGVIYNQIISVGNSILNQLYVKGALFGARPSDAFQVICDGRINRPADLENGIVNAQIYVTPVPTLERIQIDLIRVAIGQMQTELDIRGLGNSNA